jgi:hypothetical protein
MRLLQPWLVGWLMLAVVPEGSAWAGGRDATQAACIARVKTETATRLGQPVELQVEVVRVDGDWAFLTGDMRRPDGRPVDYAGTRWADAAAAGAMSRRYAALLRRQAGDWQIVELALGPTDVVWEEWPAKHGVSPALVKVQG